MNTGQDKQVGFQGL